MKLNYNIINPLENNIELFEKYLLTYYNLRRFYISILKIDNDNYISAERVLLKKKKK